MEGAGWAPAKPFQVGNGSVAQTFSGGFPVSHKGLLVLEIKGGDPQNDWKTQTDGAWEFSPPLGSNKALGQGEEEELSPLHGLTAALEQCWG